MEDPLNEMLEFLKPESRIDLRHVTMDHLLCLSGCNEGIETLLKNEQIITCIIELTGDRIEDIAKSALLILVNITATPTGASDMLVKPHFLATLIGYVLDTQKKDADAACMILSNVTRPEQSLQVCLDAFIPHLNNILNAFVNTNYNERGSSLDYLAPLFSNLSRSDEVRKWLIEEKPHIPLIKLLPFCNYEKSNIRRGGAIGTIRNISFDLECHDFLLNKDLDILTYLLYPIMGNEDFADEEMDIFPLALQYLPKEKCREPDSDIRKMVLETINKLCSRNKNREILRNNGVYFILREYHKWEKVPFVLLACEKVVDVLIQTSEEVGADDLSTIEVPEDLIEKLEQMDEDFLSSVH